MIFKQNIFNKPLTIVMNNEDSPLGRREALVIAPENNSPVIIDAAIKASRIMIFSNRLHITERGSLNGFNYVEINELFTHGGSITVNEGFLKTPVWLTYGKEGPCDKAVLHRELTSKIAPK